MLAVQVVRVHLRMRARAGRRAVVAQERGSGAGAATFAGDNAVGA